MKHRFAMDIFSGNRFDRFQYPGQLLSADLLVGAWC